MPFRKKQHGAGSWRPVHPQHQLLRLRGCGSSGRQGGARLSRPPGSHRALPPSPLHCCYVGSNPPLTTSVKTQVGARPIAHRYTKGCISYALDKGPTPPRWLLPGSHREGGPGVPAPISKRDFANVRANAAGLGLTRAARGEGLRKQHPRSLYKERTSWEVAQLCKQEPGETGHGGRGWGVGSRRQGLRRRAENRGVAGAPKRKRGSCVRLGGLERVTRPERRPDGSGAGPGRRPRSPESHGRDPAERVARVVLGRKLLCL